MASSPELVLRPDMDTFVRTACKHSIPFHIFSAGYADIIQLFLERQGLSDCGLYVLGNQLDFDSKGHFCGYKGESITALNKNAGTLKSSSEWEKIKTKSYVLLIGDSPEDVHMMDGLEIENSIKVGFLNDVIGDKAVVQARRDHFKTLFDVVIEGDVAATDLLKLLDAVRA